ncbi:type VI secretion system baseplate subunit TssE [Flocculibacter collagenilyticus]|uniref:type VI secretion system baseplate subunit TssE n=1 Tax=Flocculibacter collagenilyticus TaxID=2744479 RepID=UPI0018F28700|nr:type VI secretion system baseplate subunit TssE [Flocculibacter collagenilyticus]
MALFDMLASSSKQSFENTQASEEINSVCNHINELLNSRRGVLKHLPDYGLPDVQNIYEGLPYSQQDLAAEVKQLIEKYETRIINVTVTPVEISQSDYVVKLEIYAQLYSGLDITLDTKFATGGKAIVSNYSS